MKQASRVTWRLFDRAFRCAYWLTRTRFAYAPHSQVWNWLLAKADFWEVEA